MRSFWSQEELQQLKEARSKGIRAKSIAKFLNRTESAVHKALRRYNLLKNPEADLECYKIKNNLQLTQFHLNRFHKRLTKARLPIWVELKDVLQWLKACSISITQITPRSDFEQNMPFICYGKHYTAPQIVLLANRLRDKQNLLPFLVEGITIH